MKTHKTNYHRRDTYEYKFADGRSVVLVDGKDGVTIEMIRNLHRADDREVYNNLKNIKGNRDADDESKWNLSLDFLGSDNKEGRSIYESIEDTNLADPEEYVEISEMMRRATEIANSLPGKYKEIFDLFFVKGYTNIQVAEILDMSPQAVYAYRIRLIGYLRKDEFFINFY